MIPMLAEHKTRINTLSFSWGGRYLVSAGYDDYACVWDMGEDRLESVVPVRGAIYTSAWSGDSRTLLLAGESGRVSAWNEASSETVWHYDGHNRPVLALAPSPDGQAVASAGADRTAQVWNPRTRLPLKIYRAHEQAVEALAWSAGGGFLASAARDHRLRVWEAERGHLQFERHNALVWMNALAWNPTGRYLAAAVCSQETGELDHSCEIWDTRTGMLVQSYPILGYGKALCWLDARRLLLALAGGSVWLITFRARGLQQIEQLLHADAPISALAAHLHAGRMALAHPDGTISLYPLRVTWGQSHPLAARSAPLTPARLATERIKASRVRDPVLVS